MTTDANINPHTGIITITMEAADAALISGYFSTLVRQGKLNPGDPLYELSEALVEAEEATE